MVRNRRSRRSVLRGIGAAVGASALSAGAATPVAAASAGFSRVETGTQKSIRAVAQTAEGPYAAANNGDVVARRVDGWEQCSEKVLDAGIEAQEKSFYGADATSDGRNFWVVGESGVAGHYDVVDELLTDYSQPDGIAATWTDVSAIGAAGSETVFLVNTNGEFVRGEKHGDAMSWETARPFNGGNTLYALEMADESAGWTCDANGAVWETRNGGTRWRNLGLGAPVSLYDVTAVHDEDIVAVGGSGHIYEYDGTRWTETKVGGSTIHAVESEGDRVVAVGEGGRIFRRTDSGWNETDLDASKTLRDLALDDTGSFPDTVVGNQGYVFEQGEYTAYPDTLRIESAPGTVTEYGVGISNRTRKTALADSDDVVAELCGCDGASHDIEGKLGRGDRADAYDYGGDIQRFSVESGTAADLTTYVSGTQVSVERLTDRSWGQVDSGVTDTLFAVVESSTGLYAVGGSGKVVGRDDGRWGVVDDEGPHGGGNNLYGADTTDDGETVWMAGGSGVVGRMDAETEVIDDLTAPLGETSAWLDVGVVGDAGSETVVLVNGSGEVLRGTNDDGTMTWAEPVKPGSGSTIRGVSIADGDLYVCDGNSTVYRSTDGGATWTDIGIDDGGVTLYDVSAVAPDDITVSGGSGRVFRYNGEVWTTEKLGGNSRYAVDREADRGLVAGGSGQVGERELDGWEITEERTSVNVQGALITSDPEVPKVVTGGDGVIIEQSFADPLY